MILENIDNYPSRIALKMTCKGLCAKISHWVTAFPTCTLQPSALRGYTIVDLSKIEQRPVYNAARARPEELKQPVDGRDFFACSVCLRIRSAGKLSNAMMKGKRGKLGSGTLVDKVTRFCIPCGVATKRYQRGTYLKFGGALRGSGKICSTCGQLSAISDCHDFEVNKCDCSTHLACEGWANDENIEY